MSMDKKLKREIIGNIFVILFIIPVAIIYWLYRLFDFLADILQDFEEWITNSLVALISKLVGEDKDGS